VHQIAKYAAKAGLLFVTACGAGAIGLSLAGERFARLPASSDAAPKTVASIGPTTAQPRSPLLGSDPERLARVLAARKSWVEVVDAVNMRQGPSSADAVVKVQLAGTMLEVASREGKWVEVIEPETGETGWVFDAYVTPAAPAARRAEAAQKTIR
jgi:uncharacterized protein YgiM (DUF1202 family)